MFDVQALSSPQVAREASCGCREFGPREILVRCAEQVSVNDRLSIDHLGEFEHAVLRLGREAYGAERPGRILRCGRAAKFQSALSLTRWIVWRATFLCSPTLGIQARNRVKCFFHITGKKAAAINWTQQNENMAED